MVGGDRFGAMRTVEEHLAAVLAAAGPLPPVRLSLDEAAGLVAADGLVALVDLPGFDNSAMDGYAVRAADVAAASAQAPVRLPVVADLAAGDPAGRPVGPGEAVRIMTGAPLPAGANAVVKVEDTDAGMPVVAVLAPAPVGCAVRLRGEDLTAGRPVLAPGEVLDPCRLALLAASGHADVRVHPRPRVAVLSTGAELVAAGMPLAPGQIHDSNSHLLAAAVTAAGGRTAYRGCVGDRPEQVRETLERLAGIADVVVTSGGVSMGVHDVVKAVLRDSGEVDFVQVAMQPGKPQGVGVLRAPDGRTVPFLGLPGNPVSSFVSFVVFVRPLLRRLAGREPAVPPTVPGRLTAPLRSPGGRRQYARATAVRASDGWDGWDVTPVAGQGSHFVADLALAEALLVVPEEATGLPAGAILPAILLDGGDIP